LTEKDGVLEYTSEKGKPCFLVRTKLKLKAPLTVKLDLKSATGGEAGFAWRTKSEKDFLPANRVTFPVSASNDWQTHEVKLPATDRIIHLRLQLPGGVTQLRDINLGPASKRDDDASEE
jgi:hypothetical protein